jgi:hypothetical protein
LGVGRYGSEDSIEEAMVPSLEEQGVVPVPGCQVFDECGFAGSFATVNQTRVSSFNLVIDFRFLPDTDEL